ncbi:hypothetical protein QJS83_09955 [Bdellovibrio sp. 22V]|uniref:hypothetical protein n=1 Tax=Bdellovibrio TaxID=958 RepID=UPI002542D7BE|nr:hypothetical protein [Bdellovibrio sp. 22V]WII70783.1 hypothetical protein QJS83_09955 [Bdellovibrio sp. 22V]
MFLALLLFIGAAGLVFAYLGSEDPKPVAQQDPRVKSQKYEKSVNRHLMFTNEKMELARQRMEVENARLLNTDFNSTSAQRAYTNDNTLDLSTDTRAQELANELGRGTRKEEAMSPHDVVQRELFNAQQMAEYTQAYKEEYARQFIENARRGGYKVILSDDLSRVISVTPLRSPSQNGMDLFGSGGDALQ